MTESIIGLYVILGIVVLLGYKYLEGLPQRLHDEGIERLRASLTESVELTKISQGELQVHKTEEFVKLSEFFHEVLSDPEMAERASKNAKEKKKLQRRLLDSAVRLFFFSSDETIDAYKAWWHTSQKLGRGEEVENSEVLLRYAELNVCMRRDLGYKDTECTADDFLEMLLTDWDLYRDRSDATDASDA